MNPFSEDFPSITPVNFFQIEIECHQVGKGIFPDEYFLPDTSQLCNEEPFADVAMGWKSDGLEFYVKVNKKFEDAIYPDVYQGDSVELFIDTRDVKTSGYNTRFCHHFFFLPEPIDGHQMGEITHFRTEDRHELCDSNDLSLNVEMKSSSYTMKISIPSEALHGYDPSQFKKIGFTYRVNRPRWESQHFSVISGEYPLEQQPALWSNMRLIN